MSKTTTYVEFYYPGALVDETSLKEINHRDPRKVTVPSGSFGFKFFDVMSTEDSGVKMESDRLNISPMYYYGGRIMTPRDVRREMPDAQILIMEIEANSWARVIKCRTGNFKPFRRGDVHIKA